MAKSYALFLSPMKCQRAEVRGQRTEDRPQKTEVRGQRSEDSGNIQIGLTNNDRFACCFWAKLICERVLRDCLMQFACLRTSRSNFNLLVPLRFQFQMTFAVSRGSAGSAGYRAAKQRVSIAGPTC